MIWRFIKHRWCRLTHYSYQVYTIREHAGMGLVCRSCFRCGYSWLRWEK